MSRSRNSGGRTVIGLWFLGVVLLIGWVWAGSVAMDCAPVQGVCITPALFAVALGPLFGILLLIYAAILALVTIVYLWRRLTR